MERKQGKHTRNRSHDHEYVDIWIFWDISLQISSILQIDNIKKCFDDKAQQQIEFKRLLDEEVRLLNEIEKKRNKIRKETHEKFMDEMLDKMGAPVKWIGYKSMSGTVYVWLHHVQDIFFCIDIECEMDLLQCQKIRKLTSLYKRLRNSATDVDAKIDRIEFVGELHTVLLEEPQSVLLEEVQTFEEKFSRSFIYNFNDFPYSFSIY